MCQGSGRTAEPVHGKVFDSIATEALGPFAKPQFTDSIVGHEDKVCHMCDGKTYIRAVSNLATNKTEPNTAEPPRLVTATQLCAEISDLTVHKIKARRYNGEFLEGIHWYKLKGCRAVFYDPVMIEHYWKWRHKPEVHQRFIKSRNP
jgi:hypothetical protein